MSARKFTIVVASDGRDVAERFALQYGNKLDQPLLDGTTPREILRRLNKLKRPTKRQVDAILGNQSWTSVLCSTCVEYRPAAASMDANSSVLICEGCLRGAASAFKRLRAR